MVLSGDSIYEIETSVSIGKLIEIIPVGFLGEQLLQVGNGGDSGGRYGRLAPVILYSLHFKRAYPCSNNGGEWEPQEFGERGPTDACIAAGRLIQTCARANLPLTRACITIPRPPDASS